LRRVARIIDEVINDQDLLRESVEQIVRDFIDGERKHIALEDEIIFPAISRDIKSWGLGRHRVDIGRPVRTTIKSGF
jgi:hemerythrin-like domain-containing protein